MLNRFTSKPFIVALLGGLWITGMLAFSMAKETPVGGVKGRVVASDTGRPINGVSVYLRQGESGAPQTVQTYAVTNRDGDYSFSHVPAGDYSIQANAKVHSLKAAGISVREGETEQINLELTPGDQYFNLYIHQQLFTSKEKPAIEVDGFTDSDEMKVTIDKINPDKLFSSEAGPVREMLSQNYGSSGVEIGNSPIIAKRETRTVEIRKRDSEGTYHQRVDLGSFTPGIYVVTAGVGSFRQTGWFSVSDIGLITKESGDDLLAYAVRPDTGDPVPGVQVTISESGEPIGGGATGPDGLWRGKPANRKANGAEVGHENRLIVGRLGDSVAFLTSYSYEPESSDNSIYAYTDRPIYRPGQEVHFKGIVREFAGDAYRLPAKGQARVEVRDRRQTLIYAKSLPLSRFGTFHDGFKLPEYAATGGYDVTCSFGGHEQTVSFSVAEYRKPEFSVTVEMPNKHCVQGEHVKAKVRATYFFGAPVAGAEVHYSVSKNDYWFWAGDEEDSGYGSDYEGGEYGGYSAAGEIVTEGTVRTGADGTAEVDFAAYSKPEKDVFNVTDKQFTVNADVTDASRSAASGEGSIIATQGDFNLHGEPQEYMSEPGKETRVVITAEDFDKKPQAGIDVDVTANLTQWDPESGQETFQPVASGTVHTDAKGQAIFSFKPAKPGSYAIHMVARDRNGNRIRGATYVWVTGQGEFEGYHYPDLQVVLDKKSYNYGDTAKVMINTDAKGATALLTVEGRRIYDYKLVKLSNKSTVVEIPIRPEYRPNFYVDVCYVRNKRLATQQARAKVSLREQEIKLTVTPDKAQYEPGQTATYSVSARDLSGRPVEAEVSLGVVDEAIYEIQEDTTTPVREFFYHAQPNTVNTHYSFPNVYLSGDKAGFNGTVRKEFLDTAFWRADVVTDANGQAKVSVRLPDNLTTWRATARACTTNTAVGQTVSKVVCTKTLLVRLETPRFMVQKDRTLVSAIVHNYTGGDQDVTVALKAPELKVEGRQTQHISVPKDGMERVEWWVSAVDPGSATLTAYAVAKPYQDAMQLTIPIKPLGQREVETRVGSVAGTDAVEKLMVRSDSVRGGSEIRIRLAPSLASSLLGSLDYLAEYPYGCTEQTTSAFLPDVVIWKTLKSLKMSNPSLEKRLPDMVGRGLNRLYDFQNESGGWGWCQYGQQDIWMTAYVIYALQTARAAGFSVNDEVLANANNWLGQKLQAQTKVTPQMIYGTYVMSLGADKAIATDRLRLITQSDVSDPHDLALVTLALANVGAQEQAKQYLQSLWNRAVVSRGEVHWASNSSWQYYKDDSPAETTALAMMAVMKLTPADPRLPVIMRWLMSQRTYDHWTSTRDTAMVLYAASQYLAISKETTPDYGFTMFDNGRKIAGGRMGKSDVFSPEREVVIRAKDVRAGANVIQIRKSGPGVLYYTIEGVQYVARNQNVRTINGSGVSVTREYHKFIPRWNDSLRYNVLQPSDWTAKSFASGDILQVRLTVNSPREYQHVLVEDYLPAGCEAFDRGRVEPWEWTYWWVDMDVRDERVSFYVDTLPVGKHVLQYQTRAWRPGSYHALGSLVQAMYEPTVKATGVEDLFEVRE